MYWRCTEARKAQPQPTRIRPCVCYLSVVRRRKNGKEGKEGKERKESPARFSLISYRCLLFPKYHQLYLSPLHLLFHTSDPPSHSPPLLLSSTYPPVAFTPPSCNLLHIFPSTSRFTPAILVYRPFSLPPFFAIYRFEISLKTAKTQAVVVRSALIPPVVLDKALSLYIYSLIGIRDSTYRQTWVGGIGANAPPLAPSFLSFPPCLSGLPGAVPFP